MNNLRVKTPTQQFLGDTFSRKQELRSDRGLLLYAISVAKREKLYMRQFLYSTFLFLAMVVSTGFSAQTVQAGAWVRPEGELFMIPHILVYRSCRFWTQSHHITRGPCYHKTRFAPYMEYGLGHDFTIGAQPFLRRIKKSNDVAGPSWGDLELWGRYRLWHSGYRVFSTQWMFNIPFVRTKDESLLFPAVSEGQHFLEARLLYGTGGLLNQWYDMHWYGEGQLGYRANLNGAADAIHLEGVLGVSIEGARWIFEVKSFHVLGLQNPRKNRVPDYDLFSVQPSIIHWLTPQMAVQVGGVYDFYGRNVGKGLAYFIALFLRFDFAG